MLNFLLALIFLALLYVCYTDIRWRLIKNKTVLFIFFSSLAVGWITTSGDIAIALPLIILVIGFLFSQMKLIGPGDVKLLFALSVSLPATDIKYLLLLTAFAGLPVALVMFIFGLLYRLPYRKDIPYGVAISLGYTGIWLANTYY